MVEERGQGVAWSRTQGFCASAQISNLADKESWRPRTSPSINQSINPSIHLRAVRFFEFHTSICHPRALFIISNISAPLLYPFYSNASPPCISVKMAEKAKQRLHAIGKQVAPAVVEDETFEDVPPIKQVGPVSNGPRAQGKVVIITGIISFIRILRLPMATVSLKDAVILLTTNPNPQA